MSEARQYILPATLATLLHVALIAVALVASSLPSRQAVTPLRVQATLVQDVPTTVAVAETPEPEPEPLIDEPPPPPDDSERLAAEEAKRLEDARIEQERLARLAEEEAEKQRLAEEERRRRAAEEAERRQREAEEAERRAREEEARRKREEEERLERQRAEAERRRQEEVERQRRENERRRQEAEASLQDALNEEAELSDLAGSPAMAVYVTMIGQRIERYWSKPPSAPDGLECEVSVRQSQGGDVISVSIGRCNGDSAVRRSIESAVNLASPLPLPSDPRLFDRNLKIIFKPEQ